MIIKILTKLFCCIKTISFKPLKFFFDRVKMHSFDQELIADCDFYIANCAIRSNQVGADALMERFIENHPTSTKQNEAYLGVALFYFCRRKLFPIVKMV